MLVYHKNKLIAKVKPCKSFFSKAFGLMFTIKPKNLFLIFKKESILQTSIHMLFVFYPIDVLWLDSNYRIVDKKENIQPFSINHRPKKPAKFVLELKKNSIKELNIGDILSITFK